MDLTVFACQDQFDTNGTTVATINSVGLLGMGV